MNSLIISLLLYYVLIHQSLGKKLEKKIWVSIYLWTYGYAKVNDSGKTT